MNKFIIHFDLLQQNETLAQHVQIEINKIWKAVEKKAQVVDNAIRFLKSKIDARLALNQ